jgi:hypothetical protein
VICSAGQYTIIALKADCPAGQCSLNAFDTNCSAEQCSFEHREYDEPDFIDVAAV